MPEGQGQGQEVDILGLFCQPPREATSLGIIEAMGTSRSTQLGLVWAQHTGKSTPGILAKHRLIRREGESKRLII